MPNLVRRAYATRAASRRAGTAPIRAKLRAPLNMLPPGTVSVGAGLMVLGAGMYVHLAVAGHSLPASGMAAVSVLWSLVFLLGLGVFLPVEQELIRLVAARTAVGEGMIPVVRRFCALSAVVLAVILVPLAVAAGRWPACCSAADTAMVAELASACAAMAVTTVSRGVLAGRGAFGGTAASWPSTVRGGPCSPRARSAWRVPTRRWRSGSS